ncbi:MAG: hypothetical protein V7K40_22130 [Nostoc sp.]|uniref:hypothetical protein n=1 Tax=Nostoc sp. TaxID=1180 RepID=UPI002FFA789A
MSDNKPRQRLRLIEMLQSGRKLTTLITMGKASPEAIALCICLLGDAFGVRTPDLLVLKYTKNY